MFKSKKARRPRGSPKAKFFKDPAVLRFLGTTLVALLCIALIVIAVRGFLFGSDYFKVKTIDSKGIEGLASYKGERLLDAYIGRNIFTINLKGCCGIIMRSYPELKDVVVSRALPNTLTIEATVRRPVALIGDAKYAPVDYEGVVLSNIDSSNWKGLPLIRGLKAVRSNGEERVSDPKRLRTALELLVALENSGLLSEYGLNSINASDYKNMTFFLEGGLEIRIGNEGFDERLKTLKRVLGDPKLSRERIKYIDLRFEEAVIGPK